MVIIDRLNILVTGIGGDIGHGILKCILDSKYKNENIIGTDIKEYSIGKKLVNKFFIVPLGKDISYMDRIIDIAQSENIDIIIPSTESEIIVLSENLYRLESINVKVLINKKEIVDTFIDKYQSMVYLMEIGCNIPETYDLNNYNNNLDFPFIIKSKHTFGSKGVFDIKNNQEYEFISKMIKEGIVQENIGNIDEEYTVCVYSNGCKIDSIAFKRYLGFGSMSIQVELVKDQEISVLVEKIANRIKLNGSINIQMRKDKGVYKVFEINPRISSTVYFRHYFGFKDLIWWMDNLLDTKKEFNYISNYSKGIGVRYVSETFFELE